MKKVLSAILRYFRQSDIALMAASLLASLFGIMLIYSSLVGTGGPSVGKTVATQIAAVIIGFCAMVVLSTIDYHTMGNMWKIIAVVCIALMAFAFVKGTGPAGSNDRSWIMIGGQSIEPSEIVKVAFILTFAKQYDMLKDDIKSPLTVILLAVQGAVAIGLVLIQQDMGMVLVFGTIFICMMFAAKVQLRYFAALAAALAAIIPALWNLKVFTTQRNRIIALLNPTSPKSKNELFQQMKSVSFIGSGKLWGYGFLKGPHKASLPERQNDMIFAIGAEELGFIGCVAIILLLTFIIIRIIIGAYHAKDPMGSMICVGVFSMFSVQMLVNIGMCLMVFPVVGITLPFFSYGGTSILASYLAVGLAESVYNHSKSTMFAGQKVT